MISKYNLKPQFLPLVWFGLGEDTVQFSLGWVPAQYSVGQFDLVCLNLALKYSLDIVWFPNHCQA
jgi:hypothetical protein